MSETARFGIATSSRRRALRFLPTRASCTCRARPSTRRLATDFGPAELVEPIYVRAPDADRVAPMMIEFRKLKLRDLNKIEEIERSVVPDAVVALDVRGRAGEAVLDLPRRDRRRAGRAHRLPDHLPLRRRLARDEHRGRRRSTGARESRGASWSGCSRSRPEMPAAATRSRCASRTRPRSGSTKSSASVPEAVRRGYYTDNREDALIMWKDPVREPASA